VMAPAWKGRLHRSTLSPSASARIVSDIQPAIFSTLGIFSTSQEISGLAMSSLTDGDAELVAEETLCLVSVVTARTIEAIAPGMDELSQSLLVTPFLYRDYLVGSVMLESTDAAQGSQGVLIGERLERKSAFYTAHLPASKLPTGSVLRNVALMWMGRISPPGMPTGPEERLDGIGVTDRLNTHIRLIASHVRQVSP